MLLDANCFAFDVWHSKLFGESGLLYTVVPHCTESSSKFWHYVSYDANKKNQWSGDYYSQDVRGSEYSCAICATYFGGGTSNLCTHRMQRSKSKPATDEQR
jgi:hypothetical protein